VNVRKGFHHGVDCIGTSISTLVNTSALNVANVEEAVATYQDTEEFILERNRLNVVFVANDSQRLEVLLCTAEFTVERNHTNVACVTRHLVSLEILTNTSQCTRETNRTSVHCVTKFSGDLTICSHTNVMYIATEDHITVLTVGRRLREMIV